MLVTRYMQVLEGLYKVESDAYNTIGEYCPKYIL